MCVPDLGFKSLCPWAGLASSLVKHGKSLRLGRAVRRGTRNVSGMKHFSGICYAIVLCHVMLSEVF